MATNPTPAQVSDTIAGGWVVNGREKVDVLLTDGRTVPIVKAVETSVGVRFVDTIGRVFRPDQVVSFGEARPV